MRDRVKLMFEQSSTIVRTSEGTHTKVQYTIIEAQNTIAYKVGRIFEEQEMNCLPHSSTYVVKARKK